MKSIFHSFCENLLSLLLMFVLSTLSLDFTYLSTEKRLYGAVLSEKTSPEGRDIGQFYPAFVSRSICQKKKKIEGWWKI